MGGGDGGAGGSGNWVWSGSYYYSATRLDCIVGNSLTPQTK